jgi:hypothetical protein
MPGRYIRHGRPLAMPSSVEILDELKTGFVAGHLPISGSTFEDSNRTQGDSDESVKNSAQ